MCPGRMRMLFPFMFVVIYFFENITHKSSRCNIRVYIHTHFPCTVCENNFNKYAFCQVFIKLFKVFRQQSLLSFETALLSNHFNRTLIYQNIYKNSI